MKLKFLIAQSGVTQEQLAITAGYDPTLFSRILRGLRPMPDGFESRVMATLQRLEAAEKAAQKERKRVLAEWPNNR